MTKDVFQSEPEYCFSLGVQRIMVANETSTIQGMTKPRADFGLREGKVCINDICKSNAGRGGQKNTEERTRVLHVISYSNRREKKKELNHCN